MAERLDHVVNRQGRHTGPSQGFHFNASLVRDAALALNHCRVAIFQVNIDIDLIER